MEELDVICVLLDCWKLLELLLIIVLLPPLVKLLLLPLLLDFRIEWGSCGCGWD